MLVHLLLPSSCPIVSRNDEKPSIQALERAQGYLRFSDGQTFRSFSDRRCKRHGATTLFAALEVATGVVTTGYFKARFRRARRRSIE